MSARRRASAGARLAEATGFPADFIAQTTPWVFGSVSDRVDGR